MMKNIVFLLFLSLSAQAKDCSETYTNTVLNGPLAEEDLVEKLRCEVETHEEGKQKPSFVCVFGGVVKSAYKEKYGSNHVVFIQNENPAEKKHSALIGEWYSYKGASSNKKMNLEVLVSNNDSGSKILKKSFKDENSPSYTVEKITISPIEKTLRYEKNIKSRSGTKNIERQSLNCGRFELDDPYADKNLDKDGLPIKKGISSRARKNYNPAAKKIAPSGISGLK